MRGEIFFVDAGVVIIALQLAGGSDLQQVLIALHIFGKQQQMKGFFILVHVLIKAGTRSQISFQPDNWLNSGRVGGFEEIQRPEHGAVIGQRHSGHIQFTHSGDQVGRFAKAVQNRIGGVYVQMNK